MFSLLLLSGVLLGDSMKFQVVVPDSARVGEPVRIVLRLSNTGNRPITLYLQGRPVAFDVTIRRRDGVSSGGASRARWCPRSSPCRSWSPVPCSSSRSTGGSYPMMENRFRPAGTA